MSDDGRWADFVPDPRRWKVLYVLIIVLFMGLISVSTLDVGLPTLQEGLHATTSELQWVLSGYAVVFGFGLVAAGRAGDVYGRGPLFLIGVGVFTVASVWAGLAPDPLQLNIARLVQGAGSALCSPQSVGMIQEFFRGAERARAFGVFGAVVGVSVSIGPLLGGLLIQMGGTEWGWRWTFFINVPFGIAAVVLGAIWLPQPWFVKRRALAPDEPEPVRDLDLVGSTLLGLTVLAVMFPFLQGTTTPILWLSLPVGILLLLVWLGWENRYKDRGHAPMVDVHLFRVTSFANGTLLVSLYFLGMTSLWIVMSLYFQQGLGHTALESGLLGLPSSIISGIASLWAGRTVARLGRKVVIGGLYAGVVGLVASIAVVWLHAEGVASEWWLLLTLGLVGVAQGAVISPNQALTLAEVPLDYAGSSGAVMQTAQRIGASVGIAVITALAFGVVSFSSWSAALAVSLAAIALALALALWVGYRDLHQRHGNAWL